MNYDWRCQACDSTVKAGNDKCTTCACPASCNSREIQKFKEAYLNSESYRAQSEYRCFKCDHHIYERGGFRASGDGISEIFDVATEGFVYIACKKCGYTEIYKKDLSSLSMIADFLIGD